MSAPRALFHGTAFCTLYIMSQIKEPQRLSLLSYGTLAAQDIPCFVGECQRGIHKTGVNQEGTSWSSDFAAAARYATGNFDVFSGGARQTLRSSRTRIEGMIKEYKAVFVDKHYSIFSYGRDAYAWEIRLLDICRLRAFDDNYFQSVYRPKLNLWCVKVREDIDSYLKDPHEATRADGAMLLENYNRFIKRLDKELTFSVSTPAARRQLEDLTPIVLETHNPEEYKEYDGDEYLITSPVRLGTQIKTIYTDDKSIPKLQKFLEENKLQYDVEIKSIAEFELAKKPAIEKIDTEKQDIISALSAQINSLQHATDEISKKKHELLTALRTELTDFTTYDSFKKLQALHTKYNSYTQIDAFNRGGYKLGAMIWQRTFNPKTKTRELIDRTYAFLETKYNNIHHYEHALYRQI